MMTMNMPQTGENKRGIPTMDGGARLQVNWMHDELVEAPIVSGGSDPSRVQLGWLAAEFISAHYSEVLSLEGVANELKTNEQLLGAVICQMAGCDFQACVERARIAKAKILFMNPFFDVTEVALEVGFNSVSKFSAVFENLVGESPERYHARFQPRNYAWEHSELTELAA